MSKAQQFFSSLHYFLLFLQLPGGGGGAGVTQMVVCVCVSVHDDPDFAANDGGGSFSLSLLLSPTFAVS